jgi:thiol-disulfide isomerase/thioredoxin
MRRVFALSAALWLMASCGGGEPQPEQSAELPKDRLELPDYDYQRYQELIAGLAGTPLVVNFWGSWCPPCEDEAPHLKTVAEEYEGRVQFIGVDIADARDPAREFIERFDWPYPSIFDPRDTIRTELGYIGQPITLIYDDQGTIVWEHVGATDATELREHIDSVL